MSNYSENSLIKDHNHVWSILFDLIPPNTTVLDIGCSSGNFGKQLIENKGCTVDGIELDKSDFKKAQKNLRRVWNLNIEKDSLNVVESTYDVIILADVIEHLIDPSEALKHIQKLIKPDGIVVFSVPNMAHISVRLNLLAGSFSYTETGLLDKTHLHYYDADELGRVFEEAAMSIEKIDYPQIIYPRLLIDKKLAQLGLKSSDNFYKQIERPEYYAYQFVGIAKYTNGPKHKQARLRSKQAIQNDLILLTDEINKREQQQEALNDQLNNYKQQLDAVNIQLNNLVRSKSFRFARKLAALANYVKPKRP